MSNLETFTMSLSGYFIMGLVIAIFSTTRKPVSNSTKLEKIQLPAILILSSMISAGSASMIIAIHFYLFKSMIEIGIVFILIALVIALIALAIGAVAKKMRNQKERR